MTFVSVDADQYAQIIQENSRLQKQVTELQASMSRMVEARRPGGLSKQVREFHKMCGQPTLETPQVPSDHRIRLRLRLITEEYFEMLEAIGVRWKTEQQLYLGPKGSSIIDSLFIPLNQHIDKAMLLECDLPKFVDALADLDYVIEGSRLEFGVDGVPIACEVHRANMAKFGGTMREDGKYLKPIGWAPPDIEGVLKMQGWKGPLK